MPEKRNENIGSPDNPQHTADTRNPAWDSYAPEGHGRTDEQIRADVHAALSARPMEQPSSVQVAVLDGIVTLSGEVRDAEEQRRLRETIRAVPSVRDIRDQSRAARA